MWRGALDPWHFTHQENSAGPKASLKLENTAVKE
jgi:hypothetical protein